MVKVIQDNSKKRCRCEYCDSVLEYSAEDIYTMYWLGDRYNRIKCPCCKNYTKYDIPETFGELDTDRYMGFFNNSHH